MREGNVHKILSAEQIKWLDKQTISRQNIRSFELMERAAHCLFDKVTKTYPNQNYVFKFLCGPGNNGGDGLALARMLHKEKHVVKVLLLQSNRYSEDNLINQRLLNEQGVEITLFDLSERILFTSDDVVIDALFGIGLSKPLGEEWHMLIDNLSGTNIPVLAIDIPSGLFSDHHTDPGAPIVKATKTYTFHAPKLALLQPENEQFVGNFEILDIGLDKQLAKELDSDYYYIDDHIAKQFIGPMYKFSHKGTFGHMLFVGGSYGKIGAAILSGKAALRTGCGLISLYIPSCGYDASQSALPEAMLLPASDERILTTFPDDIAAYNVIAIGPGMGTEAETARGFKAFLNKFHEHDNIGFVFDADALNILSTHPDFLILIPKGSVLTPHPKELTRLIGGWANDDEKLSKSRQFAEKWQVILVIKGANTALVFPDGTIHFNSTGNPGMATAGTGDVLTGMVASLIAQGHPAKDAARLAIYLHGSAADHAIVHIHPKSLIASDVVAHISHAWKALS